MHEVEHSLQFVEYLLVIWRNKRTGPNMVTSSFPFLTLLTFLEVIARSDPTSSDTYALQPQPPPVTPSTPHPWWITQHTNTHTAERFFFFPLCLCPPQPAASSDRKPQFPLLLLWALHSLFLFIPSLSAFVFLLQLSILELLLFIVPPSLSPAPLAQ